MKSIRKGQLANLNEKFDLMPKTTKFELENFKKMNLFTRIQKLPYYKNRKLIQKIKKLIKQKVR